MTIIKTNGLTKRFGDVTAVQDLNLSVTQGEIYGFLGPNGAGKSTTIALLLDYVRPTAGIARILGMDTQQSHVAICRRVGVLPERCELYGRLSGRKHVEFAIRASDSPDDPLELLSRVGLSDAGDRTVSTYSTGMSQRLKLALALVGEPELLILDEPSNGLDPNGIKLLRELLITERNHGTTVLFSSHILEHVEVICDRIGIMVNGTLTVTGDVDTLKSELGPMVRLAIDVETVPPPLEHAIGSLPAVSDVSIRDVTHSATDHSSERIDVSMMDETAKSEVLRCVEEFTTVENFSIAHRSLESLFDRHVREEQ